MALKNDNKNVGNAREEVFDTISATEAAESTKRYQISQAAAKAKGRITLLGLDHVRKNKKNKGLWALLEDRMQQVLDRDKLDKAKDWFERNKDSFSIWTSTLKSIEGKFGSAVMVTFEFLRFVFLLNVILSSMWIVFIIFPFFARPPDSYSWHLLESRQSKKDHYLDSTWFFYGGYNYTSGEQKGWYRTDYMYTVIIGMTLFVTLAAVLGRMAVRIMRSGDYTNAYTGAGYPFATAILASWDFHLTTLESSSNLKGGIRMRLHEMLADCAEIQQEIATTDKKKLYKRNVALFLLFPLLMISTVAAVIFLVSKQATIDLSLRFMEGFAQPFLLAAVNISSPRLIRMLVQMEDWKPSTADQGHCFIGRLYVVIEQARVAKEGSSMKACHFGKCKDGLICCLEKDAYESVWPTCRPSKIGYCVADCADNAVAKLLLELIISSTLIDNAVEGAKGYFVLYYFKHRQQMAIEDMPIRVVYIQAVVWVASMFSPIAATLGAICNCVSFLSLKEVLMRTCAPMEKAYSASSTSDITYGLLLITLILSSIPVVFRLTSPSSGICGPVKEGLSSYQVIANYIELYFYELRYHKCTAQCN
ncbi:hypothetical protein SELMODRAFT_431105 [Selaginella moellendorffii]|uniref:TMC domain-containing protein n=1 Tax=Selaginella moellendorffii TaxID=88036 RepID=D8TBJ2_SELML|nr:hypothetical protein SELMODRAFT_431105 [Selaginella moellendorffii]